MRIVLLAAACLVAAGCMPMRVPAYRPSGPGQLESGYCLAGVQDTLNMAAPGGVAIHMRAALSERDARVTPEIYLVVPAGTSVRLLSDALQVTAADSQAATQVRIIRVTAPGPRELDPLALLEGSDDATRGHFSLWFAADDGRSTAAGSFPAVPRFSIELPPMTINDAPFTPGAVVFEAYREWGMVYCIQ